jgi:hypothetical protein
MIIQKIDFSILKRNTTNKNGFVCLGTGGNLNEWLTEVSNILSNEEYLIYTKDPNIVFSNVYLLETNGGRKDLVFVLNTELHINRNMLCMWMQKFGNCISIEDYLSTYFFQHEKESCIQK